MNTIAINACVALAEHDQDTAVRMLVALRTQLMNQADTIHGSLAEVRQLGATQLSRNLDEQSYAIQGDIARITSIVARLNPAPATTSDGSLANLINRLG